MIPLKSNTNTALLLAKAGLEDLDPGRTGFDLRNMQAGSREAKLKRVAMQFEQMLINTLLKSAFKDKPKDPEEGGGLGITFGPVNDFKAMLFAQHITDNGGLGMQEVIQEQLKEKFSQVYGKDGKNETEQAVTKTLQSLPTIQSLRERVQSNPPVITPAPGGNTPTPDNRDLTKMVMPVDSSVSSDFGWRKDPIDGKTRFHGGIDYDVPANTPIKSFMAGDVTFSGWKKGYGYMVEVTHSNGYTSRYGHNSKVMVKEGEKVHAGSVVALSGSTGRSTGPHLHFEIRKGDLAVNPARILKQNNPNVFAHKADINNVGP